MCVSVIKDWQLGPLTLRVQNSVWHILLHTHCGRKDEMPVAMVSLLLLFKQGEITGYIPLNISSTDFHSNHVLALPTHPT